MVRLTIDRRVERLEQAAMLEGEARYFKIVSRLTDDDLYDLIRPLQRDRRWDADRTPDEAVVWRRFNDAGGWRYYLMALGISEETTTPTPELAARVKHVSDRLATEHRWRFDREHRRRQSDQTRAQD